MRFLLLLLLLGLVWVTFIWFFFTLSLDVEDTDVTDISSVPPMLLRDYVDQFLPSHEKALLLLGDYGSGKTSFCYTYALNLLGKFLERRSNILPVLIKLRGYNKAVGISQVLTDYFVNDLGIKNFNLASFIIFLKNVDVVLIFDGYDEVAKKVDYDVKYSVLQEICKFSIGKAKIVITCRPNYFQNLSEFKQIFQNSHFPYEPGEKKPLRFVENTIAELSPAQISSYLHTYSTSLAESGITIDDMLQTIANTHDLQDLAKRPFLLYMILRTLPEIIKDVKERNRSNVNASTLYSVYTEHWIKREDSKNKTLGRVPTI